MLFWLFVIMCIIGILLIIIGQIGSNSRAWYLSEKRFKNFMYENGDKGIRLAGVIMTFVSGVIAIFMLIIIFGCYCSTKDEARRYKIEREYIIAEINDENCYNEYGLLEKNIAYKIEDWNDFVIFNKKYQRNFWIGIFIPNVFDDLEPIDY